MYTTPKNDPLTTSTPHHAGGSWSTCRWWWYNSFYTFHCMVKSCTNLSILFWVSFVKQVLGRMQWWMLLFSLTHHLLSFESRESCHGQCLAYPVALLQKGLPKILFITMHDRRLEWWFHKNSHGQHPGIHLDRTCPFCDSAQRKGGLGQVMM